MTNSELWDKLEPTDPRHTKEFSGKGGFSGTAINATYILKKLTDTFGPCGRGWKFVLEGERVEAGHILKSNEQCRIHIVRGHIDYVMDGAWYSTSPQFGQTFLVSENKYGAYTDEEAPKKSITDCISKCAVLLGIGADVHLGMFDDNKYVNQRLEEERQADGSAPPRERTTGPRPPKPKSEGAQQQDTSAKGKAVEWVKTACEEIDGLKSMSLIDAWHKANKPKIDRLKDYDPELTETVSNALLAAYEKYNPVGA